LETSAGMMRSKVYPANLPETGNVTCSIRPEAIQLRRDPAGTAAAHAVNTFHARRLDLVYLGEMAQYLLQVGTPAPAGQPAADANGAVRLKVFELNPKMVDTPADALAIH